MNETCSEFRYVFMNLQFEVLVHVLKPRCGMIQFRFALQMQFQVIVMNNCELYSEWI